jgi:hypothetical protein
VAVAVWVGVAVPRAVGVAVAVAVAALVAVAVGVVGAVRQILNVPAPTSHARRPSKKVASGHVDKSNGGNPLNSRPVNPVLLLNSTSPDTHSTVRPVKSPLNVYGYVCSVQPYDEGVAVAVAVGALVAVAVSPPKPDPPPVARHICTSTFADAVNV